MNITESEDQAQRLIFDWARWQQGKYPQLKAMYHAANEGKRSARAGAELKRQGMKPGVSDICLPYASGKYNNLYVELKVGNGKATDNQLKFVDTINSIGGESGCSLWQRSGNRAYNCIPGRNYRRPGNSKRHIPEGKSKDYRTGKQKALYRILRYRLPEMR